MTVAEATPTLHDPTDTSFLGHPRGLAYLAFTEAWERFSYYGMQTLLVLYMVNFLLLPGEVEQVAGIEQLRALFGGLEGQAFASAIFGTYAATVYLTPIAGGWIADRFLGKRRTVLLGAHMTGVMARQRACTRVVSTCMRATMRRAISLMVLCAFAE